VPVQEFFKTVFMAARHDTFENSVAFATLLSCRVAAAWTWMLLHGWSTLPLSKPQP
jgi:hypothetical protein